ncbi:S-adenosyl-L-methionine-dependent methyltransferase [Xylaria arbuscula]|nr:S-adenosyl-L-methionine-dependent methyltransferase [Xylaria arbuscula]
MSSLGQTPRIAQLAKIIAEAVVNVQQKLTETSSPFPSFDEDSPVTLPPELSDSREVALAAASELFDLLSDPITLIRRYGGHNNSVCLQAIARFKIAGMIPLGGTRTYAEIAEETGISEHMIRRLIRYAMTMHIFHEPESGVVGHTKASRILAGPEANDWLKAGTEEMWPAAVRMMDALQKWPNSSEPNETGYSLSSGMGKSIYEIMGSSFDCATCLANSMKMFAASPEYDISYLIDSYDWNSLGQAQVLDVGGARGHVAMGLASRFPNLNIIVQDMKEVVENAEADLPAQLYDRVKFMSHELFSPQNTRADIVLFRWVLHNWSDKHCLQILRAQVPMLEKNSRIIIQEMIMPEAGDVPLWKERDMRSNDLDMAAVFNSKERSLKEWKTLVSEADPRFAVGEVKEPKGSALGTIEVIFTR